jgi:hypothetical protein
MMRRPIRGKGATHATHNSRQVYLDHGRVQIELPRLMSDAQLADVFEEFVKEVRAP